MADLRGASFCPAAKSPKPRQLFRNPPLAETWKRILRGGGTARVATAKARSRRRATAFYKGFVAEAIDRSSRGTEAMDQSGSRHRGVIIGGRHRRLDGELRHAAHLRLPRLPREQDPALGTGSGLPADARAAQGLRSRRDGSVERHVRPHRGRGHEARLRGSGGLLRRSRISSTCRWRRCFRTPIPTSGAN